MKKRISLTSIILATMLLVGSGSLFAQRGERGVRGERGLRGVRAERGQINPMGFANLDLSEEQQAQFLELRAKHQKNLVYQNNLIQEDEVHLKTLLSAPEKDLKAINQTIDKITEGKGDLMKKRITNHEEMKSILSPEQVKKMETFTGRFGQQGQRNAKGIRGQSPNFGRGNANCFGPAGMANGRGQGMRMQGKGFNNR